MSNYKYTETVMPMTGDTIWKVDDISLALGRFRVPQEGTSKLKCCQWQKQRGVYCAAVGMSGHRIYRINA